MERAMATATVQSWEEAPYWEGDDRKLTKARVVQKFIGDVQGVCGSERESASTGPGRCRPHHESDY